MSEDDTSTTDGTDDSTTESNALAVTSPYKVLGNLSNSSGVGVLGQNDAGSGKPVGVKGAVPGRPNEGYGLSTPNNARVEGDIESPGGHTFTVDGSAVLDIGTTATDRDNDTGGNPVVAGYSGNKATEPGGTVGGGGASGTTSVDNSTRNNTNEVEDTYGTIGGGKANRVKFGSLFATIGGGKANTASGRKSTIGGGVKNTVSDRYATVSGGRSNTGGENYSTVGGGWNNDATATGSTIGGGEFNNASGENATVGGGEQNHAYADYSTIAGGGPSDPENSPASTENEVFDNYGTIGGGGDNQVGKNNTSGTDNAIYATIPGGRNNEASGKYSFAAGRNANATTDGSFVWADSNSDSVTSQASDQFLVEASGGTGIGTENPVTTLHVKDDVAESGGGNLGRHVVAIENTNNNSSSPIPDVLGLQLTNQTDPTEFNSYISFMDEDSNGDIRTIGNIQGDGNGGVEFVGSLADFAEFFPKADPDAEFEDGEVVGLHDGEIVSLAGDAEADTVLVVSTAPLVTGNRPLAEDEHDEFVKLSLVGQVPVQVSASVDHGDVLVASPDEPGTAIAREDCDEPRRQVGMALEAADAGEAVLTLVGGPNPATSPASDEAEQIESLRAENERLRDELSQKDERIDDLEERLAAIEAQVGMSARPADD